MKNFVRFDRIIIIILFTVLMQSCGNDQSNIITGSGSLEATEINIRSKTGGQILEMLAKEGTMVNPGNIIAVVDTEKLALQREQIEAGLAEVKFVMKSARGKVASAEEQLENVKKKFERITSLYNQGSATQQQMDDIETQHNLAKTQLRQAKSGYQASQMKKLQIEANLNLIQSHVDDCYIKSPATGTVIKKYVEQGETISQGMSVVDIADLSRMWIKLYVTAQELGFVTLNERAEIMVDSFPEKKFSGKVIWISPKAEFTPKNVQTKEARADLVYAVKIELANPDNELKIGMPADIIVEK